MPSYEMTDEFGTKTYHLDATVTYKGEVYGVLIDDCPDPDEPHPEAHEHECFIVGLDQDLNVVEIPEDIQEAVAQYITELTEQLEAGKVSEEDYGYIVKSIERD